MYEELLVKNQCYTFTSVATTTPIPTTVKDTTISVPGNGSFYSRKIENILNDSKPCHTKFMLKNISILFPDQYEFLHVGHCAGGWLDFNTRLGSIIDCRNECESRPNARYFSYCNKTRCRTDDTGTSFTKDDVNCACYLANKGCPNDSLYPDHNSYRIIGKMRQYKYI